MYKKYTEYYVFIITCVIPLLFLPTSQLDPFILPKIVLWTISLLATIVVMLIEKSKTKKPIFDFSNSRIYWILALYACIWTISTFFSVDWFVSLTGIPLFNGLIQLYMSIVTFLLITNHFKFEVKYINYISIVYIVVAMYCVLQFYDMDPFVPYYGDTVRNFIGQTFSTIGNQNNVSTCLSVAYVVLAFFYIFGNYSNRINIYYFMAALIIFAGGVVTKTRGGWLAIAFSFLISIPMVLKNKPSIKKYLLIVFASAVVFLAMDVTSGGAIIMKRILPMLFEFRDISTGSVSSEFGSRRLEIWMNSVELIKKYWLIGSGPDTFTTVYSDFGFYPKDSSGKEQILFLSAHNQSIQLLITTGIFSLLTYWLMVSMVIVKGMKKISSDKMIIPLLLGLVCYLVKGMLNGVVVTDMIIFWVLLGLIYSYQTENRITSNNP